MLFIITYICRKIKRKFHFFTKKFLLGGISVCRKSIFPGLPRKAQTLRSAVWQPSNIVFAPAIRAAGGCERHRQKAATRPYRQSEKSLPERGKISFHKPFSRYQRFLSRPLRKNPRRFSRRIRELEPRRQQRFCSSNRARG